MTRDTMLDSFNSMDMAQTPHNRRKTIATTGNRDVFKGSEEPAVAATRRMSIGEPSQATIYDWEQPRLDIEGFVTDYFTYRMQQMGIEWYDRPNLPCGVQPEHEMMRLLASVFEKRHRESLENFSDQLLAKQRITFPLYQEVVQTVGNSRDSKCPMSYGRLIGLIAFGGMVATKMMSTEGLQGQVSRLLLFTSAFIKSRIRDSWKEHNRSWKGFMMLGENMKAEVMRKEQESRNNRRWSMIGVGVTASAIGIVGIVVCGRMIFSLK